VTSAPAHWTIHQDVSREARERALNTLRMLRPYKAVDSHKIRLGRPFDGGYVMLDSFDGIEAAYSLGINDDVSWDLDVARRGIPVFQYDHSIERLPQTHERFHWEKTKIGGIDDVAPGTETLTNLIMKNGHQSASDLLLKCDIEGWEWLVLRETESSILKKFRQIVVEIHEFYFIGSAEHGDNARATFANIISTHQLVHIHGNNAAPLCNVGGIALPNVVEMTFVRKDAFSLVASDETFPTALDMPCWSDRGDYHIGTFTFT
jgi:hypothetical protein